MQMPKLPKKLPNLPTLREETCQKKVAYFRGEMLRASQLTWSEREQLLREMQEFADSLSTGNVVLGGAGIGAGAGTVLPVLGTISGSLVGGIYGAYKANKLSHYRDEVLEMIRTLAR